MARRLVACPRSVRRHSVSTRHAHNIPLPTILASLSFSPPSLALPFLLRFHTSTPRTVRVPETSIVVRSPDSKLPQPHRSRALSTGSLTLPRSRRGSLGPPLPRPWQTLGAHPQDLLSCASSHLESECGGPGQSSVLGAPAQRTRVLRVGEEHGLRFREETVVGSESVQGWGTRRQARYRSGRFGWGCGLLLGRSLNTVSVGTGRGDALALQQRDASGCVRGRFKPDRRRLSSGERTSMDVESDKARRVSGPTCDGASLFAWGERYAAWCLIVVARFSRGRETGFHAHSTGVLHSLG
ncbi:hypothetical protein LXA43DRAFT_1043613 [Ganoderma leucocontextum]|nr:hypothetical protein LXA43DRAFT_1043613 [Ganoderma leucocontextum]